MEEEKEYPELDGNVDFNKIDESVLRFWNSNSIFEESIKEDKNKDDFVFYDGPPFASGLPHY